MWKYGIELEYFIRDETGKLTCPRDIGLASDEFPILGEVRSAPHDSIYLAVADINREMARARDIIWKNKYHLDQGPEATITREQFRKLLERPDFHKGSVADRSIYGKKVQLSRSGIVRAGLHIHFSNMDTTTITFPKCTKCGHSDSRVVTCNNIMDIPYIVSQLDQNFASVIRSRHRQPGIYELKPHGFEYRSLPNDVNLDIVAHFIEFKLKK